MKKVFKILLRIILVAIILVALFYLYVFLSAWL